jgi:hypothetical protein
MFAIPAFLIPLLVQVASKGIEMAFNKMDSMPPTYREKIEAKIEKKKMKHNFIRVEAKK